MPESVYEVRVYNTAGALQYVADDIQMAYTNRVNQAGFLRFGVDDGHLLAGNLARDWRVDVLRSRAADSGESNAIGRYVDFSGFVRNEERRADADGNTQITYFVPGVRSLLGRAVVGYAAGTDLRSAFTSDKAETILKNLVKYNLTSSGTTGDGRVRNAPETRISIQADGGGGNTLDYACAWRNVLEVLQDVASVGGGDYDLVRTGANGWEFRWYAGQLGTDRSASVIFALQYGNMANPVLNRNWIDESTVAIVGGQGEESDRTLVVRTGTNYSATVNSVEMFVDARDLTTTAGLNARGDVKLYEAEARDSLTFDVIQTPGSLYGLHYFLGDKVAAYYQGISATNQIVGVTVDFDPKGQETLSLEMKNV